jgi:hypothetical protein
MSTIVCIILILIALGIGYMIADYQAYWNLHTIINDDKAVVGGKGWGVIQF